MRRALALTLLAGCSKLPFDTADPVPDFALEDANPTSATFGREVSPRDQLGRASAWYFGHAT